MRLWLLFVLLGICGSAHLAMGQKEVTISNDLFELTFNGDTLSLLNVTYTKGWRMGFLIPSPTALPLWEAVVVTPTTSLGINSLSSSVRSYNVVKSDSQTELQLRWTKIKVEQHHIDLAVSITIKDGDPLSHWDVTFSNPANNPVSIWSFTLSALGSLGSSSPENDYFVNSFCYGNLYKDPVHAFLKTQVYGYPATDHTMQMMAWYNERDESHSAGIYFATHDPNGNPKYFILQPHPFKCIFQRYCPTALKIQIDAPDGGKQLTEWNIPYFVMGVFEGNWWDASLLYRSWVIPNSQWTKAGLIKDRPDIPKWFKESALWANTGWTPIDANFDPTSGDPDVVVPRLLALQKVFQTPMILHWYVWDEIGEFDTNYPNYLPEKPGFAEAVKVLQKNDIRVVPYINGRLFDLGIPLWKEDQAERYCVKLAKEPKWNASDIYVHTEDFGSGSIFAVMCPYTTYWQDKISSITEEIFDLGVDGIYIDQISAAVTLPCADPTHGHTLRGGDYWAQGYRTFLKKVTASRRGLIVSEENAEIYMDTLGGYLAITAYINPFSIPMFASVYGGYMISFGNIFEATDFAIPNLFTAKLGTSMVEGLQMGWFSLANMLNVFDDLVSPKHTAEINYLRLLASYRKVSTDYLVYGRLMKPVKISPPSPVARGILHTYDVVNVALWLSQDTSFAKGASLGIFVTNGAPVAYPLKFSFNANAYGLTGKGPFSLFNVDVNGTTSHVKDFSSPQIDWVGTAEDLAFQFQVLLPKA